MLIFLISLFLLMIYKTKYQLIPVEFPLSRGNVNALRGIMAIEIVLGHTYGARDGTELLYVNDRIGLWPVGIFFFLSGYGLMYSLHHKEQYCKGFLKKRIFQRIFIPFLVVFIIRYIVYYWQQNIIKTMLADLISNWFVTEILLIYILWWVIYSFIDEKKAIMLWLIATTILNIIGCIYGIATRWYASTACFLVGIIWEKYEKVIKAYLQYHYIRMALCSVGVWGSGTVLFLFLAKQNSWIACICMNITCVSLCILVYLVLMKFNIGNKATNFLGRYSWEIYLLHPTVIGYLSKISNINILLWMILCMLIIVSGSWGIHKICSYMNKVES